MESLTTTLSAQGASMKDYKRFTTKNNWGEYVADCKQCQFKECDVSACRNYILKKLGEIEDKIEQGLLLELGKFYIRPVGNGILADSYVICRAKLGVVSDCLTKEEAEAELAELRGEK